MKYLVLYIVLFLCISEKVNSQVLIYGDSRSNPIIHKKLANTMLKHSPLAVFNTGDLVFSAKSTSDWQFFINATSELRKTVPYYPIIGNHEKNTEELHKIFNLPNKKEWYTINIQGISFIVLNSNETLKEGSEQHIWLEGQLSESQKNDKFTLVLFHHPPFSSGTHRKDPKKARKHILPLLEKYGVDAVFSGHVHFYERIIYNKINYITTGGGGAPIHQVGERSPYSQKILRTFHFCELKIIDNKLHVSVFDSDDNLIDSFDISQI